MHDGSAARGRYEARAQAESFWFSSLTAMAAVRRAAARRDVLGLLEHGAAKHGPRSMQRRASSRANPVTPTATAHSGASVSGRAWARRASAPAKSIPTPFPVAPASL
jgi:hypothetical protein